MNANLRLGLLAAFLSLFVASGCGGGGAFVAPTPPPPAPLLFKSVLSSSGSLNRVHDGLQLHWGHYDPQIGGRLYVVFEELGFFGAGDIGTVRTLRAEDTADFALFAEHVTNGIDEPLRISLRVQEGMPFGWTRTVQESASFLPVLPGVLDPDAVGCAVERVEVELLSGHFDSPGQDRNGDGQWTDHAAVFELRVYGHPQP